MSVTLSELQLYLGKEENTIVQVYKKLKEKLSEKELEVIRRYTEEILYCHRL